MLVDIGIDTNNNIYNIDLCKTPHLLIAGTTGSGKSILINTILLQLIQNYTPQQLQLVLIDPKQVEMAPYENVPHLDDYIVTNLHDAKNKLDRILNIINTRYKMLKNSNNKNIKTYNKTHKNKIPYIVVVIDELADLILEDRKQKNITNNIDDLICRIAQIGRASGVHLIVSTQRPSVDIITGLIKSNIPSRIALNVATATDSKVILDTKGAERLTKNGDMLLKLAGINDLIRLQGIYVTEQQQEQIINDTTEQYKKYIQEQEQKKEQTIKQITTTQTPQKAETTNTASDEITNDETIKDIKRLIHFIFGRMTTWILYIIILFTYSASKDFNITTADEIGATIITILMAIITIWAFM